MSDPPHGYMELFIPSLVYHLGFELPDVDAISDLYAPIRWRPEYTVKEALAAKRAERSFLHPFKTVDALELILAE